MDRHYLVLQLEEVLRLRITQRVRLLLLQQGRGRLLRVRRRLRVEDALVNRAANDLRCRLLLLLLHEGADDFALGAHELVM